MRTVTDNPSPAEVRTAILFSDEPTLDAVASILRELQESYDVCLEVIAWPETVSPADRTIIVNIRTGSVLVDVAAAAEPAGWAAGALLLLKTLIAHAGDIVTLPLDIQDKWYQARSRVEESRLAWIERLQRRAPAIDDDARERWRERKRTNAQTSPMPPSPFTWVVPEPLSAPEGIGVKALRAGIAGYIEWIDSTRFALLSAKDSIESIVVDLGAIVEGTDSDAPTNALSALAHTMDRLEESTATLGVAHDQLEAFIAAL
jgi:hypothetical protein